MVCIMLLHIYPFFICFISLYSLNESLYIFKKNVLKIILLSFYYIGFLFFLSVVMCRFFSFISAWILQRQSLLSEMVKLLILCNGPVHQTTQNLNDYEELQSMNDPTHFYPLEVNAYYCLAESSNYYK